MCHGQSRTDLYGDAGNRSLVDCRTGTLNTRKRKVVGNDPATMVSSPSAAAEPASKTTQKGDEGETIGGDLVDATCMAKVLGVNTGTSTEPTESSPAPAVPHLRLGLSIHPKRAKARVGRHPDQAGRQMPSGPPSAAPIQKP